MTRLGRRILSICISAAMAAGAAGALWMWRVPDLRPPAPPPASGPLLPAGFGVLRLPVPGAAVQTPFGWTERAGRPVFQPYLLLQAAPGSVVSAVAAGMVVGTHEDPTALGLYVEVDHAGGWSSLYGGCGRVLVSPGRAIPAGAQICVTDTPVGVPFGLRVRDHPVNPAPYLDLPA